MSNKNDHDTYIIPPNFIETGTFFGGMFRARNVIEAGILVFAIGAPVFLFLPFGLTTRIIILCLTALPVGLVALIGISGESLSQFLVIFLKYLRNRRVVGGDGEQPEDKAAPSKSAGKHLKQRPPKEKKPKAPKRRRSGEADFPAEFDEVRSYEIREKLRPKKNAKKERPAKANKAKKKAKKRPEKGRLPKRPAHVKEQKPACLNPVADYLPIEKVENGIIYTKDHRFVKVVEVVPINFMLRSAREQRNIIYSFVSYLKISPVKLQIKVLTRRADINRHLDTVRREMAHEENEQCRLMQEDYLNFVQQVGSREAVTRRFFLIFEYEPWANTRRSEQEDEAIQSLQSAVHTASNYLRQCGNEVIVPENEDEFTVDVLYNLLCRNESAVKPLSVRAQEVVAQYMEQGRENEIDHIPAAEFAAPRSIDFSHGRYICIDGLYPDNYETLSTDAALRAERIACRLRHLIYSSTTIRKGDYLKSASVMHGITITYENEVLAVTLPSLLPKRRQRQSAEFLLDPLYFALEQYAKENTLPHYRECVVCFAQVYDQALPTRRVRDYDNLEEKQILDLLSSFVMADDTGLLCDAYNTAELGEQDCTMIFVMEKHRFPGWLAEHKSSLKSISDF